MSAHVDPNALAITPSTEKGAAPTAPIVGTQLPIQLGGAHGPGNVGDVNRAEAVSKLRPMALQTFFGCAIRAGLLDLLPHLLALMPGIVSQPDEFGVLPLHNAARSKGTAIVRLLLSAGADPMQPSESGQLPLQIAFDQHDRATHWALLQFVKRPATAYSTV